jgi:hypothetical protein
MKSSVFWDMASCSLLKVNQRLGETCRLHLQGWRISRVGNQQEGSSACHLPSWWYHARLILQPWIWRWHAPLKWQLTFNGLHGVISQKTELILLPWCFHFWVTTVLLWTEHADVYEVREFRDAVRQVIWQLVQRKLHVCTHTLSYLMIEIASLHCHLYLLH